jgi:protein-S-isoprenylcysteine O-methyltransferase Ste14
MSFWPFIAVATFVFTAMVVPVLRARVRTGEWGIAIASSKDPVQRLVGASLMVAVAAILGWSVLSALFEPDLLGIWAIPALLSIVGWVLMALGLLLVIAAQANMGASWRIGIDQRPTALVTGGLYTLIRNPIYTGMIVAFLGFVLVTPAPWTVMMYAMVVLVLELQTRLEEKHLIALHGQGYLDYASRVGRFFPGIGKL